MPVRSLVGRRSIGFLATRLGGCIWPVGRGVIPASRTTGSRLADGSLSFDYTLRSIVHPSPTR
jgi:hypothetical protein